MAFRVFEVADQGASFVVLILFALICIGSVVLRFVATHQSDRKAGLEDWCALVAALFFLARTGFMLYCFALVNGRTNENVDPYTFEMVLKLAFAASVTCMLDQTFAKLSICALYRRIFGVNQAYRRWVYILGAAQCATCIVFMFIQFLQCRPLQSFWIWPRTGCMPWTTILVVTEPPNSIVDFGLVVLAMVMTRSMQLKSSIKWKARVLFGLGAFAGIFGFIKVGMAYNPNPLQITASVFIWGQVHSLVCIVCCCAPVYGALKAPELWNRAASKIHGYGRSSKRKEEKTGSQQEPWQNVPLDRYFEGEGWSDARAFHNGSTRRLVTSDVQPGAPYKNEGYPVGSIQVDRHVDVDYPGTYQALGHGMDSNSTETSRLSRPNASHQRAQSPSPDV